MPRTKIPNNVATSVLIEAGYRCAVPTCRNILAIDMHHIVEVKDGGPNELSNLLALCPTCHALYTRGTIPKEAINAWKTMLVALNHAFDQETISNLLFLHTVEKGYIKAYKRSRTAFDEIVAHQQSGQTSDREQVKKLISELNLLVISGDGVLKFSHLIASNLATFQIVVGDTPDYRYLVELTSIRKANY